MAGISPGDALGNYRRTKSPDGRHNGLWVQLLPDPRRATLAPISWRFSNPLYSRAVTVKVPPKGTHGVAVPRFLMRIGNRMVLRQFRRSGMRTGGGISTLLLETLGAKSGRPRHAVLGYIDEGGGSWLVIASSAGAAWHPAWLYNLADQPEATIEFDDGRRVPVRAETLDGPQAEAAWTRIATDAPEYVRYRSKTDRDIPVLRLRQR
jgi:deazaflavin-dependent oxidoreductase (nitroreductase family)